MRIRDRFNVVNNKSNSFSGEWFCTSPHFESSLKPSTQMFIWIFLHYLIILYYFKLFICRIVHVRDSQSQGKSYLYYTTS